jgi:quercetin dioxygenase-like cupin family protein
MIGRTTGSLAILLAVLLLQPGCATDRTARDTGGTALVVQELVKSTRSWDGAVLPAYPQGQPEVTILRIRVPAGARLETHRHPVINAGVLLSGQLTVVTADGRMLQLKAGDPIVEVVHTLHHGVNRGTTPAEIIVVYAGAVGVPITVVPPR